MLKLNKPEKNYNKYKKTEADIFPIDDLCNDIKMTIFLYVENSTLFNLMRTSKEIYALLNTRHFWFCKLSIAFKLDFSPSQQKLLDPKADFMFLFKEKKQQYISDDRYLTSPHKCYGKCYGRWAE